MGVLEVLLNSFVLNCKKKRNETSKLPCLLELEFNFQITIHWVIFQMEYDTKSLLLFFLEQPFLLTIIKQYLKEENEVCHHLCSKWFLFSISTVIASNPQSYRSSFDMYEQLSQMKFQEPKERSGDKIFSLVLAVPFMHLLTVSQANNVVTIRFLI